MIVNVNSAASPSASVTFHVYSVRGITTTGVPLTLIWEAVVVAQSTPSGRAGWSVYASVPSPPLAFGSTTGSMPWFCVHDWSSIISENDGMAIRGPIVPSPGGWTGGITTAAVTLKWNSILAVSPSASVTVHVYSVNVLSVVGVPLTRKGVVVARVTLWGNSGDSAYISVPSPPLAVGRTNGVISMSCVRYLFPIVCAPNVGIPSTSISNVNDALSPSASVAVHVYSVLDMGTPGVPLTTRVVG